MLKLRRCVLLRRLQTPLFNKNVTCYVWPEILRNSPMTKDERQGGTLDLGTIAIASPQRAVRRVPEATEGACFGRRANRVADPVVRVESSRRPAAPRTAPTRAYRPHATAVPGSAASQCAGYGERWLRACRRGSPVSNR